ncbi:MAG TPA: phosphotransferase [Thermoanaerobaculia bacterium]|nr:phosphotransferase [Thermoanaerobaculia bacterium]
MQISTADSLLRDLLERELVSRTKAVDGDVLTVSAPERHWFRVLEKDGKQFFARGGGAGLERERALYGAAGALDVLPPLRVAEDDLLVFETFGEGYDIIEFHRSGRRVAEWLPALIGRALALLHGLHVALPREQPARLRPAPGTAPAVAQAIARVAAGWTGETPIHGNAGFESIIVAPEPARRIHLIGFDDACLGDPAWDLVYIYEDYGPTTLKAFLDRYAPRNTHLLERKVRIYQQLNNVDYCLGLMAAGDEGSLRAAMATLEAQASAGGA